MNSMNINFYDLMFPNILQVTRAEHPISATNCATTYFLIDVVDVLIGATPPVGPGTTCDAPSLQGRGTTRLISDDVLTYTNGLIPIKTRFL